MRDTIRGMLWQTPAYFHRRVERDAPKSKRWHSFVQQSRTYQPEFVCGGQVLLFSQEYPTVLE